MPRLRKLSFVLLTAVLTLGVLEVAASLLLEIRDPDSMSSSDLGADQVSPLPQTPLRPMLANQALHPYLGFVLDAGLQPTLRTSRGGPDAVNYGFFLVEDGVFHSGSQQTLVVALTGGSLAFNLARRSAQVLRDRIKEELTKHRPDLERIVVVNLALPGYKQPQQLMALAYFYSLGADFDVVVNLDGFNEIALAPEENVEHGVFPFYPRAWYFRVNRELDPETSLRLQELAYLKRERERLRQAREASLLRFSRIARLLNEAAGRRMERRIFAREMELLELRRRESSSYTVTGPSRPYSDPEAMYADLVEAWARCSVLMHQLSTANDALYLHFLQPNQYVAGTKPMTTAEQRTAIAEGHVYAKHVRNAYGRLVARGRRLQEDGVRFYDLTRVFQAVKEPVYEDKCCHVGSAGDRYLASAIARAAAGESRLVTTRSSPGALAGRAPDTQPLPPPSP